MGNLLFTNMNLLLFLVILSGIPSCVCFPNVNRWTTFRKVSEPLKMLENNLMKNEVSPLLPHLNSMFLACQGPLTHHVRGMKKRDIDIFYLRYTYENGANIAFIDRRESMQSNMLIINLDASSYGFPLTKGIVSNKLKGQETELSSKELENICDFGIVFVKQFISQVLNCSDLEAQVFQSATGGLEFKVSDLLDYRKSVVVSYHKVYDNPPEMFKDWYGLKDFSRKKTIKLLNYERLYPSYSLSSHYRDKYSKAFTDEKLLFQVNNLFQKWERGLNESKYLNYDTLQHDSNNKSCMVPYYYKDCKYRSDVYTEEQQLFFTVCDQDYFHPPIEELAVYGTVNITSHGEKLVQAELTEVSKNGLQDFKRFAKSYLNCSEVAIRFSYSISAKRLEISALDVDDNNRGVVMLLEELQEIHEHLDDDWDC